MKVIKLKLYSRYKAKESYKAWVIFFIKVKLYSSYKSNIIIFIKLKLYLSYKVISIGKLSSLPYIQIWKLKLFFIKLKLYWSYEVKVMNKLSVLLHIRTCKHGSHKACQLIYISEFIHIYVFIPPKKGFISRNIILSELTFTQRTDYESEGTYTKAKKKERRKEKKRDWKLSL